MMGDPRTLPELEAEPPRIAILPVGSFEQHGAHLPYTTDTLIAQMLAEQLARPFNALLLPPLPFSCSHEHAGFPASVSFGASTLIAAIHDVVRSLERSGIRFTVLVNGHGGNYVLGNIAQELNQDEVRVMVLPQRQHWQAGLDASGLPVSISADMHGGALETSLLMHAMPEVVREAERRDHEATQRPWLQTLGMRHYTDSGIIGFPEKASAAAGQLLLQGMVQAMTDDLTALLRHGHAPTAQRTTKSK